MNISNQILLAINNIAGEFGVSIDWSSDMTASYIEDLVVRIARYKISVSIMFILIFIALSIVLAIAIRSAYRSYKNPNGIDEQALAAIVIACALFILIFVIVIIGNLMIIFKCINIPELVLIDMIENCSS